MTVDQSEAPQQRRQQPTDIINAKQRGRLFAIQKATAEKNGGHPTDNEVREYMENMYDKVSTQKLTVEECDDVVAWIESQATEI